MIIRKLSLAMAHKHKPRGEVAIRPSHDVMRRLPEVVAACRLSNMGGGACHMVSEWLAVEYGWTRVSGTYLSPTGDVICGNGHLWNVLPDGSWLDATADQFGEGDSIRVIQPSDPEHARYRPEIVEDFHPGCPEFTIAYPGFPHLTWNGRDDEGSQEHLVNARGPYWWCLNPAQIRSYLLHDAIYSTFWSDDTTAQRKTLAAILAETGQADLYINVSQNIRALAECLSEIMVEFRMLHHRNRTFAEGKNILSLMKDAVPLLERLSDLFDGEIPCGIKGEPSDAIVQAMLPVVHVLRWNPHVLSLARKNRNEMTPIDIGLSVHDDAMGRTPTPAPGMSGP